MVVKNNIEKGARGEDIAAQYLVSHGCKIIERNRRYSKNAEIDIIAEENGTLIFVEVKTRSSLNFGHPFEAINHAKLQKINSAMLDYLKRTEIKYNSCRIDCIAVTGLEHPVIEHIKNIGQY